MKRATRWLAPLLLALSGCQTDDVGTPVITEPPTDAPGPLVTQDERFVASDGISLLTRVGGANSLEPRPVIVEFSPYSPGCCTNLAGPGYNYLQVHIRGTGDSDGGFDALGPARSRMSSKCSTGPATSRGATAASGSMVSRPARSRSTTRCTWSCRTA